MNDYTQSYTLAGVNTQKSSNFVNTIAPIIKSTARSGTSAEIGGFGGFFDLKSSGYKDPILVAATDGVGTKLKLAIESGIHHTIGIDLVAMCINDLLTQGAEPLFFLDYFAMGTLLPDKDMRAIIAGIVHGCHESRCALIGGETAEMPGMYAIGDYDLAGFAVGAVERNQIINNISLNGDELLIGLPSSGFHSNGFALVRKITHDMDKTKPAPFAPELSLYSALLTPTRIYVKSILSCIKSTKIKKIWNITGGGFYENLARGLDNKMAVVIDKTWHIPSCFSWLAEQGNLSPTSMFSTFNCGIGMVLAIDKESAKSNFIEHQLGGTIIGRIQTRDHNQDAVIISDQCLSQFI